MFYIFVPITVCVGIGFTVDGYYTRIEHLANKPEGYVFPMWGDTWVAGVATLAFTFGDLFILNPIFNVLAHAICKVSIEEDEKLHNLKA